MYSEFGSVLIFIALGVAFVLGNLVLGHFIRLSRGHDRKTTVYECGEPTIGSAWIRYNSRFYNVALVYLLFDVEVVLLLPAVLVFRELADGGQALLPLLGLLGFLALLILGLAYEWFYGNLDWIRSDPSRKKVES